MKITIQQHDHSISYKVEHDDINLVDVIEIIENMLRCSGYYFNGHLEIVNEELGISFGYKTFKQEEQ